MTTEAQVRSAKGPPDALLAIAQALDRIEAQLSLTPAADGWGDWSLPSPEGPSDPHAHVPAFTVSTTKDETVVEIKAVSEEKQDRRHEFATSTLQLEDNFPGIGAVEAYAVGGPVWLYEYDYNYVKALPVGIKRMMVADLMEDDVQASIEMGRDLLKGDSDGPPGAAGEWV
jgi:hypothetical protein